MTKGKKKKKFSKIVSYDDKKQGFTFFLKNVVLKKPQGWVELPPSLPRTFSGLKEKICFRRKGFSKFNGSLFKDQNYIIEVFVLQVFVFSEQSTEMNALKLCSLKIDY